MNCILYTLFAWLGFAGGSMSAVSHSQLIGPVPSESIGPKAEWGAAGRREPTVAGLAHWNTMLGSPMQGSTAQGDIAQASGAETGVERLPVAKVVSAAALQSGRRSGGRESSGRKSSGRRPEGRDSQEASSEEEREPQNQIVRNVHILQTPPRPILRDHCVWIQDGVIRGVGPGVAADWPLEAPSMDGMGGYLSPGFVDAHAHLPRRGERAGEGLSDLDLQGMYIDWLRFGVLHLRSMRGADGDAKLRLRLRKGKWTGPNLVLSAPAFGARNLPEFDSADVWLLAQKRKGFKAIKCLSGLDGEALRNWVDRSHEHGLLWLGHAPKSGLAGCVEGGVDGVEHISPFVRGHAENPEAYAQNLAALGKRKVSHSANLLYYQRLSKRIDSVDLLSLPGMTSVPESWLLEWEKDLAGVGERGALYGSMVDAYLELQPQIWESGIQVLLSPSAGPYILPGYSYIEEARLMAKGGLSPAQVWQAATTNAFAAMGMDRQYGEVGVGKRADLVLLRANPLLDVEALATVEGIFLRGRWLSQSELVARRAGLLKTDTAK